MSFFFAFEDPVKIGFLNRACLVGCFPLCNFYLGEDFGYFLGIG